MSGAIATIITLSLKYDLYHPLGGVLCHIEYLRSLSKLVYYTSYPSRACVVVFGTPFTDPHYSGGRCQWAQNLST